MVGWNERRGMEKRKCPQLDRTKEKKEMTSPPNTMPSVLVKAYFNATAVSSSNFCLRNVEKNRFFLFIVEMRFVLLSMSADHQFFP